LALNPNGHIPVLVDARPEGHVVVWESMACVLYLTRVHGTPDGQGITPCTAAEEADALRWAFWSVTEVEKDALSILMHRLGLPVAQRNPAQADQAVQRLCTPFGVLEQHLQRQQERGCAYLATTRFTVADLMVAAVVGWAKPASELMGQFPLVSHWLERCMSRPAQQAVRQLARAGA
jgi:glutathione S-transferase